MFRIFACCIALSLACVASAENRPTTIRVTTADGKPAVGAKVWLQTFAESGKKPVEPPPLVTDGAGKAIVPAAEKSNLHPALFIRDASGRVGSAQLNRSQYGIDDDSILNIVLLETVAKSGRVTDARGKPTAGAIVSAFWYETENRNQLVESGPASSIMLPQWEVAKDGVKTDADGRFKLPAPKAGYSVSFRVAAEGFGKTEWSAPPSGELDVSLQDPGTLTIAVAGVEPSVSKNRSWRLNPIESKPALGVRPILWRMGTFDGTAKVTLPFVSPGRYELQVYHDSRSPAIFEKGPSVEVVSGKVAALTAKFGPAARRSPA